MRVVRLPGAEWGKPTREEVRLYIEKGGFAGTKSLILGRAEKTLGSSMERSGSGGNAGFFSGEGMT